MNSESYPFDFAERTKRGFINAVTNVWMWSIFIVGIVESLSGDDAGRILILLAGVGMIICFIIGCSNGTSMEFTPTEFRVEGKENQWFSFPYDQYQVDFIEEKRSINLFRIYLKQTIYVYQKSDGQLVYTANARNIPNKKFNNLRWITKQQPTVPQN